MNPQQPNQTNQKVDRLFVSVKSPQQTHYEGWAKAISSINNKGKFDILGYHANFITIIKHSITIHLENKEKITIPLEQGVIKVSKNNVRVFLGISTLS
jgi:F0F1-type ATP synthase epsilon subunit